MRHEHTLQNPSRRGDGPRRRHRHDRPVEGGRGPRPERRHGRGRPGHRGGRSRGDVRVAVLLLLDTEPMHGYQLMQAVADATDGRWRPSPGAVYPSINQLEDEGLVTVTAEGGRKLVTLTDAGRAHVAEHRDTWPDPFAESGSGSHTDLRSIMEQVHGATRQLARTGDDAQLQAAAEILGTARRALYLLLADGPAPSTAPTAE